MGIETIILVFVLLFGWGCFFNWVTDKAIKHGWTEGFMWLFVVVGCGVTLGGVSYLCPDAMPYLFIGFTCSGTPMAIGAILRYVKAREQAQQRLRKDG